MNVNLQNYLDRISSLGMIQLPNQSDIQNQPNIQTNLQDRDSYIPSMTVTDVVMPTSIYNSTGTMVEDIAPDNNVTVDSSDDSATSENETAIQTVIINGMVYREITTTENGIEVTTRELIGAASEA